MATITHTELSEMVETKLTEIIAAIQLSLGVEHGDVAGIFFSGSRFDDLRNSIVKTMSEYLIVELAHKEDNEEAEVMKLVSNSARVFVNAFQHHPVNED